MFFYKKLLDNHVLANAAFVVVLLVGALTYINMPRSQDPEINFNWINIVTLYPGASAEDVEKLVTDPLEESLQKIPDIKFVSSTSRENMSTMLIRFNDISTRLFDKRVNDLRREVQNKANSEFPDEVEDPTILEITTANSLPTAMVVVSGEADDEVLRRTALNVKQDLERLKGVDKANPAALVEPELQIEFYSEILRSKNISPTQVADTVNAYFRDIAAGNIKIGTQEWLVRLIGTDSDPGYIGSLPIIGTNGEVTLDSVAKVSRGREDPEQAVSFQGRPAVILAVTKQARVNTLELVDTINQYIQDENELTEQFGINVHLLDDQSITTQQAIGTMQSNALLGLILVMLVTWWFLGAHIALFLGLGIPFTLAGTFWFLDGAEQTINQSVLLGVVIVLGMLVDDAVVVVESIYFRVQRGMQAMQAAVEAMREVFSPVTSSVMTTMAAFLPLMLMPGIVGDFMFVIPFVVSAALAISLLEAYWILPVHVAMVNLNLRNPSRIQRMRINFTHTIRVKYCQLLTRVLRRPGWSLFFVAVCIFAAAAAFAVGLVRVQFFAFDPLRLFYINVEMPSGTPLHETLKQVEVLEAKARKYLLPEEIRGISSVAGQMFTEMDPFFGDQFGQLAISLNPRGPDMRSIREIVDAMNDDVMSTVGPSRLRFFILEGGPPKGKPINIKVRGDDFKELRSAVNDLQEIVRGIETASNIADNDSPGKLEMQLKFDTDAIRDSQLNPADIARIIRLMFDGEIVASMQHQGEELEVRVRAIDRTLHDVNNVLDSTIALPNGGSMALGQLVSMQTGVGKSNIRHYNFRRTITLEADIDKEVIDTVQANKLIVDRWNKIRIKHPTIDLDFSGELDDIQESLDSMLILFLFGVGLIYLILGTQFKSYWQPLLIIGSTVPLALVGVTYGLVVSQNPLSLFTMYGVVALIGIAVNSGIVMIHAANMRLESGMSLLHATIYAARRRVIPILITSLTTIAGLFSLAVGLGGKSLLWGPVASAIVWGLAFSTTLTLFVIPLLYSAFMKRSYRVRNRQLGTA